MSDKTFMNGTVSDVHANLQRVRLPYTNDAWDINGQVAMINENTMNISALFTSRKDNNTDPICNFPQGFKPLDFRNNVPANNSKEFANLISQSTQGDYGQLTTSEAMMGDVIFVNLVALLNVNQEINIHPFPIEEGKAKTKKEVK